MKTSAQLELRCPECGDRDPTLFKKSIVCDECGGTWAPHETWKCYSVVRQCVSKLDYEHYLEKSTKTEV